MIPVVGDPLFTLFISMAAMVAAGATMLTPPNGEGTGLTPPLGEPVEA